MHFLKCSIPSPKHGTIKKFQRHKEIYQYLSEIVNRYDEIGAAARQVKADYDVLKQRGLDPEVRTIDCEYYERSQTDLHVDRMPVVNGRADRMGTVLCAYTKPVTRWARNEDCDGGLRVYGPANPVLIFNLKSGAQKFEFEPGDMVRMAAEGNLNNVDGFIHNAELPAKGELRLLLLGRVAPGNR